MLQDRQDVQQSLSRMFVRAVASVEYRTSQFAGEQVRRARRVMTRDYPIDPHRLDRLGRVDERFAFGNAAACAAELDRIGSQTFRRQRKTIARPGAIFEEQIS